MTHDIEFDRRHKLKTKYEVMLGNFMLKFNLTPETIENNVIQSLSEIKLCLNDYLSTRIALLFAIYTLENHLKSINWTFLSNLLNPIPSYSMILYSTYHLIQYSRSFWVFHRIRHKTTESTSKTTPQKQTKTPLDARRTILTDKKMVLALKSIACNSP